MDFVVGEVLESVDCVGVFVAVFGDAVLLVVVVMYISGIAAVVVVVVVVGLVVVVAFTVVGLTVAANKYILQHIRLCIAQNNIK